MYSVYIHCRPMNKNIRLSLYDYTFSELICTHISRALLLELSLNFHNILLPICTSIFGPIYIIIHKHTKLYASDNLELIK